MKNKQLGICILFLISVLLVSNIVCSLGVTPARKIVEFKPNLMGEGEFSILNSEHKSMKVSLYTEDVFDGGSINLETKELIFTASDDSKKVKYTFVLPENFNVPGKQMSKIIAREIPMDNGDIQGTVIGASVAVVHQFRVDVPYPGKYIIPELRVSNTGRKDQVDFIVAINSLGTENIGKVNGTIEIYNALTLEKITSLNVPSLSVKSGELKEVGVVWSNGVVLGKYVAKLKIDYDGTISETEREFTVGDRLVDILYIYAKDFRLGQIAKFNILVDNKWPEKINDVYTEFFISKLGDEVASFKSASEDIDASSTKELTAYWDTDGVDAGEYNTKIALNYNGEKVEIDVKTIIGMTSIIFEGLSGAVVGGGSGLVNQNFLIGAIILVVLTSAFWYFYFKFKKKK